MIKEFLLAIMDMIARTITRAVAIALPIFLGKYHEKAKQAEETNEANTRARIIHDRIATDDAERKKVREKFDG